MKKISDLKYSNWRFPGRLWLITEFWGMFDICIFVVCKHVWYLIKLNFWTDKIKISRSWEQYVNIEYIPFLHRLMPRSFACIMEPHKIMNSIRNSLLAYRHSKYAGPFWNRWRKRPSSYKWLIYNIANSIWYIN